MEIYGTDFAKSCGVRNLSTTTCVFHDQLNFNIGRGQLELALFIGKGNPFDEEFVIFNVHYFSLILCFKCRPCYFKFRNIVYPIQLKILTNS